ncbi:MULTISPECIES: CAP family protein [unclassified Coleofasciculus]|uniref:CAP family protein n=1 Tax=unclassified Coleofasciculus TaxID=2692782 RepID=UPI0018809B43|nr:MULTISPECIES: CAP family protein [unclassified Coleofasciculus]MBE9128630.1 secretion protein [Coleofasciculus sp. LEGE 07081]MBE9147264.1 secretion protein [Coleofasciculus sp. LEGE 07092]
MNRKQLIGVTLIGLAAILPLEAIGSGTAVGQTAIDLATMRSTALSKHNTYRAMHHNDSDMSISDSLNSSAQGWAEKLAATGAFEHSGGPYGENIYVSYSTGMAPSAATLANNAVQSWYDEVKDYNYTNPGFSSDTGHFTQVVWKSSTQVGCGAAQGTETIDGNQYNAFYVVCQYTPAGNMQGQFPDNVLKP